MTKTMRDCTKDSVFVDSSALTLTVDFEEETIFEIVSNLMMFLKDTER